MVNQQSSANPGGGLPPTRPERAIEWARRTWRRLMDEPATRWATFGVLGVVAVLLLTGGILWMRPQPETIDGFIARWNQAVEENDETLYNDLLMGEIVEANPSAYARGIDFLRELHYADKRVQPVEETPEETDKILVPATVAFDEENNDRATLTFSREEGDLVFSLERKGWGRKWEITDIAASAPIVSKPERVLPDLKPETSSSTPNIETASMTVGEETTPLDTELKLRQILEAWRTAWENKEIDAYMAWYADYAVIRRVTVVGGREIGETLTKTELRHRMERLARKYDKIEVGVSNVNVQGDYAEAKLRFRQEYTAWKGASPKDPTYHDIGVKTLKFVNEDGVWKIYEEDWSTYVNVPRYPLN